MAYAHNIKHGGDKFSSLSGKCKFIGYPLTQKGYNLYHLETHEFFISCDVKFLELLFPFSLFEVPVVPVMAEGGPTS